MLDWVRERLVGEGMIGVEDVELMQVIDDPDEVCEVMCASADLHCAGE